MICESIIGNLSEDRFKDLKPEFTDFCWDEAFKKVHKKVTGNGREIGIRLDDSILTRGLRQGDVLAVEGDTAVAVNLLPCQAIVFSVDDKHSYMTAKACYEIGNRHAPLFWGEKENEFITPYNEPMLILLERMHGVTVRTEKLRLDFDRRISAAVSSHTH